MVRRRNLRKEIFTRARRVETGTKRASTKQVEPAEPVVIAELPPVDLNDRGNPWSGRADQVRRLS